MEMIFGSLIQTHIDIDIEVKLHFTSQKPTALRQFKIKDSFTTIKVVIETLIKNQVSAYWHSSLLRLESQHSTFQIPKPKVTYIKIGLSRYLR